MRDVFRAGCLGIAVWIGAAQAQDCVQSMPLPGDYHAVNPLWENGLASVKHEGKEGLIDRDGRVVLAPQYARIASFSDGRAWFEDDEQRYGFLDENGKVVIAARFEFAKPFSEGLAAVQQDGRWGYIDRDGQVLIPAQYDFAGVFSEGVAAVRQDGKWQWIDKEGKVVAEIAGVGIDHIEPVRGGVAIATRGNNTPARRLVDAAGLPDKGEGNTLLVNRAGQVLVDGHYLLNRSESDPEAPIAFKADAEGLWGLYDHQGKVLVEAKYDSIGAFGDGLAPAESANGKWGFIDEQGREVIAPAYDFAWFFREGLASVHTGDLIGYIDTQGREVIAPQPLYTEYFKGDFARVKDTSRAVNDEGLMDKSGRIVLSPEYVIVHLPFVDGRSFAAKEDGWFMLDASACKVENGKK